MDIPLTSKLLIGSFNIFVWIKLFEVDEIFRKYSLTEEGLNLFINRFQKAIKCGTEIKKFDYLIMMNTKLCLPISISTTGRLKQRGEMREKLHYIGHSIFDDKKHETLIILKDPFIIIIYQ